MTPSVRPLVSRLIPYGDEGFTSYFRRCLAQNAIPKISQVMAHVGMTATLKFSPYAARKDSLAGLSLLLGLNEASILALMHRSNVTNAFYKRRVSPRSLQQEPYDRSVWSIAALPYCPGSLELLIDKCPQCGNTLQWRSSLPIVLCQICMEDLRRHPSSLVPDDDRQLARTVGSLLSYDLQVQTTALRAFPEDLQQLTASQLFDVGLHIGRIVSGGFHRGTLVRDWLPLLAAARDSPCRLEQFLSGFRILKGWPYQFEQIVLEASEGRAIGDHCTMLANLRSYATEAPQLPTKFRQLILKHLPTLAESRRRPSVDYANDCRFDREYDAFRQTRGLLTHKEAATHLGIKMQFLADAERLGYLPKCTLGVRGSLFRKEELDALCTQLGDRVTFAEAKQISGFSSLAVEQLVAARALSKLDDTLLSLMKEGPFVLRSELSQLMGRICDRAGQAVPASNLISIGETMRSIGGRDKPWYPLIKKALAGRISIYPGIAPTLALEAFRVRLADLPAIQAMSFSFNQFPEFQRNCALSGPEWAEYLNIGKPAKEMLVRNTLLPINTSSLRYLCPFEAVRKFAAENISIWEIRAALQAFTTPLPLVRQMLEHSGIQASYPPWFWPRRGVQAEKVKLMAHIVSANRHGSNGLSAPKTLAAA